MAPIKMDSLGVKDKGESLGPKRGIALQPGLTDIPSASSTTWTSRRAKKGKDMRKVFSQCQTGDAIETRKA